MKTSLYTAIILLAVTGTGRSETRLKELISIEGVRDNQLIGYGLVVGLAGTGDRVQTVFSAQSLTNLLERMGLTVSSNAIQGEEYRRRHGDSYAAPFLPAGLKNRCDSRRNRGRAQSPGWNSADDGSERS